MVNMIGIQEMVALEAALLIRGFSISTDYGQNQVNWTATKSTLPSNYFILEIKQDFISLESKVGDQLSVTEFPVFVGFEKFKLAMRIVDVFLDRTRDTKQLN